MTKYKCSREQLASMRANSWLTRREKQAIYLIFVDGLAIRTLRWTSWRYTTSLWRNSNFPTFFPRANAQKREKTYL